MFLIEEVRLSQSAVCRAWTAAHGCFSATEWERELITLPGLRQISEGVRLQVSEALSVEGVDPLGIMRKLLVHESTSSLSRAWLRDSGFVHLEAASGIHLYALWGVFEAGLQWVSRRFLISLGLLKVLRTGIPLLLWISVFALSGFRPGLIRPLGLVGMRWAGRRFGFRWARMAPILVALSFDAAIGFLGSFGGERSFLDWAPGELHYAAAWWGGIFGYEWARARGYGGLRAHAALSIASWLTVLPLDLLEGRFSLGTPAMSLLTVECLSRGGYPILLLGVVVAIFNPQALQWMSLFLNRGVGFLAEWVSCAGLVRRVDDGEGVFLAYFVGFSIFSISLAAWIAEKQRKSRSGYGGP